MTVPAELHLKQGFIRHADQKMHPKAHGQMSKVSSSLCTWRAFAVALGIAFIKATQSTHETKKLRVQ